MTDFPLSATLTARAALAEALYHADIADAVFHVNEFGIYSTTLDSHPINWDVPSFDDLPNDRRRHYLTKAFRLMDYMEPSGHTVALRND